jgi:hypothetical protein
MDEMKQSSEIDEVLREIAKQRDKMLSKLPALSPERRGILTDFLAAEFPVETALHGAATKRDQLLTPQSPEIPVSVESALGRLLGVAEPARAGDSAPIWLRLFRSPLGAALTICALIAAAILCLDGWVTPSPRQAENSPHAPRPSEMNRELGMISDRSPIGRTELFARKTSIVPFNLNTKEPASLQASFLANNSLYFADGNEAPLGLRLDLSVRATLMEDGLARTP